MAIQATGNMKIGIGVVENPFLFLKIHTIGKNALSVDVEVYENEKMEKRGTVIGIGLIETDLEHPAFFLNVHDAVIEQLNEVYPDCQFHISNLSNGSN